MTNSLRITIVEYGLGNTCSVGNALSKLGYEYTISGSVQEIQRADVIILPGVGAFDKAMSNIESSGLEETLYQIAQVDKKPLLGICVGMQVLADYSYENGKHKGLGLIPGEVLRLDIPKGYSVPHVGWNDVNMSEHPMFIKNGSTAHFYFDHSYHFVTDKKNVLAFTDYGLPISAVVHKENVCGVQFHPEKSQISGLKFLRGFMEWAKKYA